ncbi:MAG: RNA polymerase sigma-70 factor [Chitinophagaceae bacterium]|nr:RNA polymerase sigma-70 factor [Chitinophagaceae bacterium]
MDTQKKQEESEWIALLANDSEYAFKHLYGRYNNRVYKLAMRYLKSTELSQEIVQDVFLKLWFERKNIQSDRPLEAWLITVAKNKLINQFKKLTYEWNMQNNYKAENNTEVCEVEAKLMTAEYDKYFRTTLNQLPQMQKQVFEFAKIDGLSHNEIAVRLKISPLTVKTHMARAMGKIKKSLKQFVISL